VQKRKEQFGRKFIVFPNPIYGSWVRGAFPEGMPVESEVLDQLRGYGQ
jgi:predicted secreted acid phosphatase